MLKIEWHDLLRNKFMIAILFIISLIPAIYAVTFLSSMWDPYGRVDQLPVAVVNHDQPASMNGQTLTLGDKLEKNLVTSKSLDFKAVDAKKAADGLKSGKYYAVYTIPANFSKNATTLLDKNPKQMQLGMKTSSGQSFIAGKIASGAGTSIQSKLNGQIASQYSQVLVEAVTKLENGMTTAGQATTKLADGAKQVDTGAQTLNTNLTKLANGSLTLENGSKTLSTGIGAYVAAVVQAQAGSQQVASGLNTVNAKLPALSNGLGQLQSGSQNLSAGLNQSAAGTQQVNQGATTLNTGLQTLSQGSNQLAQQSAVFSQQLTAFANQLKQSGSNTQLQSVIQQLQTAVAGLSDSTADQNVIAALDAKGKELGLTADQLSSLEATTQTQLAATQKQQLAAIAPLLTQLQQGLSQAQNPELSSVLTALTNGANQLTAANQSLATNSAKLAAGSQSLQSGTAALNSATSQLTQGANQLSSGISSALPQVSTLASGVNQLATGANSLNTGLSTIVNKGGQLSDGANQLQSGLATATTGSQQLAAGSQTLTSGTAQVASGNQTLANKLNGTAMPTLHYTSKQSKAFASPIALKSVEQDKVPNNGTGMAPYMLGVSLFVCSLAVNLMYDSFTPHKRPKNGFAWFIGKTLIMDGVAALAATIALFALILVDGFAPINLLGTWGLAVLTAVTFMSIVTWLNLVLGRAGSFFAMILLVLQLGGSGGTYPIILSNGFFQAIHPYLPLSYTVEGFRQTMMIGNSAWGPVAVLLGFFLVFSLLEVLHYQRLLNKMQDVDFTDPVAVAAFEHKLPA